MQAVAYMFGFFSGCGFGFLLGYVITISVVSKRINRDRMMSRWRQLDMLDDQEKINGTIDLMEKNEEYSEEVADFVGEVEQIREERRQLEKILFGEIKR